MLGIFEPSSAREDKASSTAAARTRTAAPPPSCRSAPSPSAIARPVRSRSAQTPAPALPGARRASPSSPGCNNRDNRVSGPPKQPLRVVHPLLPPLPQIAAVGVHLPGLGLPPIRPRRLPQVLPHRLAVHPQPAPDLRDTDSVVMQLLSLHELLQSQHPCPPRARMLSFAATGELSGAAFVDYSGAAIARSCPPLRGSPVTF